jgi:hypothetical protein
VSAPRGLLDWLARSLYASSLIISQSPVPSK